MNRREPLSFDAVSLLRGGRPWFPTMGEMHYSRFDPRLWQRSLYRMKAGGVDIVSSYVIWIHHEEIEGEFDFSGCRDLRRFVQTAGRCGLSVFVRIGPWVHAEVRNGGFPDWLLYEDFEPRTNDEGYFAAVTRFYRAVFEQLQGLFYDDGGPIIGVQIENEYGHCGGLTGEAGEAHMRRLTTIAREIGFRVPLWTATGWGGAVTGGLLPVMGAYCDAPWDSRLQKLEPNPNYLILPERNDKDIGSDRRPGEGLTFDPARFPYLMAELGGGLNSTCHRRLAVTPSDIGAMALCKLGGGCNLLGYYMYHGGTNPVGKRTTLQESRATGSINDMPVFNYDGRAPLRQYGQFGAVYKELRLLALFTRDFGEELCRMPAEFAADNAVRADDFSRLRYAVRRDGASGYLFINNYQRGLQLPDRRDFSLTVADGAVTFSHLNADDGDYFFYPFGMKIGGATLRQAKAVPLCRLGNGAVFYTDGAPEYEWEGRPDGPILTLTRRQALDASKVTLDGRETLLLCAGQVTPVEDGLEITDGPRCELAAYPALSMVPAGFAPLGTDGEFTLYGAQKPAVTAECRTRLLSSDEESAVYELTVGAVPDTVADVLLHVAYSASQLALVIDGETVNDDFYAGDGMEISLAYYGFPQTLVLRLTALHEGDPVYLERPPVFHGGRACTLDGVTPEILYTYRVETERGR